MLGMDLMSQYPPKSSRPEAWRVLGLSRNMAPGTQLVHGERQSMQRVLVTGAAGGIGTYLRRLLKPVYSGLVISDMKQPADLESDEKFIKADLTKPAEIEKACEGIEGIVHLGGFSVEGPWETILNRQYHRLLQSVRGSTQGGRQAHHLRLVEPRRRLLSTHDHHSDRGHPAPGQPLRPEQGVRRRLGALYAYKHGIGVTSLRIGNVNDEPIDVRRLSIWLKPDDLVRLIRIGLERPGLVYEVMYGVSDNARSWYDNSHAAELGYKPEGRSKDYEAAAFAAQAKLPKDEAGDFYQGGTFCSSEYSADFATMKSKS